MIQSRPTEIPTAPRPVFDRQLIAASQRPFRAAAEAQRHALGRLGQFYGEGLRFMALRLEANRSAARHLAGCRNLPETVSAWTAYLDGTAQQYSEEFERVAGLCSTQTREVIDEVRHDVAEAIAIPADAA